ncbi:Hemolysins-related protein containing CBS domains [Thermoplasmatales archaeon BRNA1]|nr:Hemolysins-related protein containing CBS domains [Thermoplasmatales archaeon BRNA1]
MELLTIVLIFLMVVLLALSAFFSATETAYSSMSRTRLKSMDPDGENRKVQRALANSEDFDRFLTTILVGNNIVNIASSTICTAILSEVFGPEWGVIYATVLMITVLLVVGEITPKTFAKKNAERFSIRVSGTVHWVMVILSPITWVFLKLTHGVSRVAGADGVEEPTITEDELAVMIDEIQQEGTLEKSESELIKSAMEFDDKRVEEICTPRVDMTAVPVTIDMESMKEVFAETQYSRIPVYEGTIDRVIGAVFLKDFFSKYAAGKKFRVTDIIRPVKFVPASTMLSTVLNDLQKAKLHLAIVLDDYGGTVGMVTMEDVLEELVGEIYDEGDVVRYPIAKEPDGTYTVLGDANIFEVMEKLGQRFDEDEYDSVSVGGYIYYKEQRIPQVGDEVDAGNVRMIVKSIRNRRIREVTFVIDEDLTQKPEE